MSNRTSPHGLVIVTCAGLLLVGPARAATLTWDANNTGAGQTNGAGAWLGANQWWDGSTNVTWASGDDAVFAGTASSGGAVTLASPTVVNSLTFSTAYTGTYTLGTSGQTITLNGGITKNAGSGAVSIVSPITLAATQAWTNNSSTTLTTSNGTNLITIAGYNLTVGGTGTTIFGVQNNSTAALAGSGDLIKNGSGRLAICGLNSGFTGKVSINGGVLQMYNDAGALGAGNVELNGGVLSIYWSTTYSRTLGTGNNQVQILGGESGFGGAGTTGPTVNIGGTVVWGASGEGSATGFFNPSKFVLGDASTANAGVITFSSGIDLNGATRTIVVPKGLSAGGNRATISGLISNSAGTAGLVKEGDGYLTLSNNSSAWNGATTVSGGLFEFAGINIANIGGGSGRNITVASGAAVRFNALTNAILNRIVETSDEIGIMTGTTANSFDFSSSTGANLPNAFLGNYASNGAKMEYSGTFTPASDNYRLGAPRNSGLLGMTNSAAMTGAQGLIVGNGSVQLVGAKTFSGDTVIRAGARLGLAAFTGGSESLALQNSVLDVGSAGGNFWLHSSAAIGPIAGSSNTTSAVFGGLKGTRNLSSVYSTTTGANNSSAQAVTAITGFTLDLGTGVIADYSGAIGGFGAGAAGGNGGAMTLTISGNGKQILRGVHSYTGATAINGGTLEIAGAGSINSSASVTVATGGMLLYNSSTPLTLAPTLNGTDALNRAILGGSGTISTAVTLDSLGDTLSPGNSPGVLSFDVSQSWASHSYDWELNDWTAAVAGTNIDQIAITGSLALTGGVGSYQLNVLSLTGANVAGDVPGFSEVNKSWTILTTTTGITGFDAANWTIDTTGFSSTPTALGTWSLALGNSDNDLVLTYTAVPEPAGLALLGLGGLLMLPRRRQGR